APVSRGTVRMSNRFPPTPILALAAAAAVALAHARAADAPQPKMVQKVYAVADLVIPINDYVAPAPSAAPRQSPQPQPVDLSAPATKHEDLIRLITSTVAPQSWSANGGRGTIDFMPIGMALVVNQPCDIQEQVACLLDSLR